MAAVVALFAVVVASCSSPSDERSGATTTSSPKRDRSSSTTSPPAADLAYTGPSGIPATDTNVAVRAFGQGSIAFGGVDADSQFTDATLERRDGDVWRVLTPGSSPSPRSGSAMAWDDASGRVILFGGIGLGPTGTQTLGDTWAFDGTTWTELHPRTSPTPRFRATMSADPRTRRVVMYGGVTLKGTSGVATNETWKWDGSTWVDARPAHPPAPPLVDTVAMAVHPAGPNVVMVQSSLTPNCDSECPFEFQTYLWNGSDWTAWNTPHSPGSLQGVALGTNLKTGQVILAGGRRYGPRSTPCNQFLALPAPADHWSVFPSFLNWLICDLDSGRPTAHNDAVWHFDGTDWLKGNESPWTSKLWLVNRASGDLEWLAHWPAQSGDAPAQSIDFFKNKSPYEFESFSANEKFIDLGLGAGYSCGLKHVSFEKRLRYEKVRETTKLVCWGHNGYGQLGNRGSPDSFVPVAAPISPVTRKLTDIAAGAFFACVLLDNGEVRCWGANPMGQLADGTTVSKPVPNYTKPFPSKVTKLAAGKNFACAVLASGGRVMCWGANDRGQLGNGTTTNSSVPVFVKDVSGVTAIAAGTRHVCAIAANKTMWCWGAGDRGELGNGKNGDSSVPVPVSIISTAVEVAAGSDFTCTVVGGALVKCWGANDRGQLGNGTTTDRNVPVAIPDLDSASKITAGTAHACVISAPDLPMCWGANEHGQITTKEGDVTLPLIWTVHADVLRAGGDHTCLIPKDASYAPTGVSCRGDNQYGQSGRSPANQVVGPSVALMQRGSLAPYGYP